MLWAKGNNPIGRPIPHLCGNPIHRETHYKFPPAQMQIMMKVQKRIHCKELDEKYTLALNIRRMLN